MLLSPSYAQSPTEQQVKAVYVYNFVNFVEWPESAFEKSSGSFVIGIAGSETYSKLIEELVKGETYQGRSIEVRNIADQEIAKSCHVLFIDHTCPIVNQLIAATKGKPILTVSEVDDFLTAGGMVRFFLEQSKVRIEINQKLSSDHNLLISAKLLRLSKIYNKQ
jgi:hypothetical protein